MNPNTAALLKEIVCCPVIQQVRSNRKGNYPCQAIVSSQGNNAFQVPEPWRGDIESAPILFVSSNPNIGDRDLSPAFNPQTGRLPENWNDEQVQSYFQVSNRNPSWISEGVRPLLNTGQHGERVPFWSSMRALTESILGRPVRPWIDYALTEVVHCKSKNQIGVRRARVICAERYLGRVLTLSPARLVVVSGDHARQGLVQIGVTIGDGNIREARGRAMLLEASLAGEARLFVCLAHPNARRNAILAKNPSPDQLKYIKSWLSVQRIPN
jgi:hypothetical protein